MNIPRTIASIAVIAAAAACGGQARTAASSPLVLERSISLAGVRGRIDHLAIDSKGQRLFVAALGNGSVEALDLKRGVVSGSITGIEEPQGLAYLAQQDELAVASADGFVRFYRAADLGLMGALNLGDDADDVRVDSTTGDVIVGYGSGGLAIIDPVSRHVVSTLSLPAHPEGFQIDAERKRAFVNLPGAARIAVGDLAMGKVTSNWRAVYAANYPMLYDPVANAVIVAYRLPSRLVAVNADTGAVLQDLSLCGDSDDLYLDARRHRLYVSCGSGDVDVFSAGSGRFGRMARIQTAKGARTSLFDPELDRLYVAARASSAGPGAILVYRPGP